MRSDYEIFSWTHHEQTIAVIYLDILSSESSLLYLPISWSLKIIKSFYTLLYAFCLAWSIFIFFAIKWVAVYGYFIWQFVTYFGVIFYCIYNIFIVFTYLVDIQFVLKFHGYFGLLYPVLVGSSETIQIWRNKHLRSKWESVR